MDMNSTSLFSRFLSLIDTPHATIFLYHRVADISHDPQSLSVSVKKFKEQIQFLREHYHIIPLSTLAHDLGHKKITKKSIAITFDDGYADNLYTALPILQTYNVPATIFVTVQPLFDQKTFEWDKEVDVVDRGRPMTTDELKKISESPLIEIGAHTMNHPRLSHISKEEQQTEIEKSKKTLEKIIGKPVISFAYPFGTKNDFTQETIDIVTHTGFSYACSAIRGPVKTNSDIYALPRRNIKNWTIDEFTAKLKEWNI